MSFGKMNTFIDIVSNEPTKDTDGFMSDSDTVIATARAYFEQKNSSERWLNMAQSEDVDALFRIRFIPGIEITTRHFIRMGDKRYNIYSVENVRNKNMYLEILAVSVDG
jgi:SPP1 family predicted phage head-tail adaptor